MNIVTMEIPGFLPHYAEIIRTEAVLGEKHSIHIGPKPVLYRRRLKSLR